jgi:hypothetical protein
MSVIFKYYKWEALGSDGKTYRCENDEGQYQSINSIPKDQLTEFRLIPQREKLPPITILLDDKRKLLFERIWTTDAIADLSGIDISFEITRIGWIEDDITFSLFIFPDGFVQIGGTEPELKFATEYYHNLKKYS